MLINRSAQPFPLGAAIDAGRSPGRSRAVHGGGGYEADSSQFIMFVRQLSGPLSIEPPPFPDQRFY
jgi:hypothetical protein